MKCPRWLCDVRSVEARTGWPRPVCKRFVTRVIRHKAAREVAMWIVLIFAVQVLWGVAMFRVSIGIADGLPHLWLRLIPALQAIALAGLFVLLFRSRRRKVYRELAEFRRAPWCLKCRYPTPEAASICPECGEPIPPEIAQLAAEREDE